MMRYQCFLSGGTSPDVGRYIGYGIQAVCEDRITASIADVTTDGKRLAELADTCTRLQLDDVHLQDVIEDFLAG